MAKVTLAKALKLRKRMVQQVAQLDVKISRNNSVIEGNPREGSVKEMLVERRKLVENLVAAKVAMYRANDGVQERIFKIAELKGMIQQLQALPTTEGKQESYSMRGGDTVYVAELKKGDVEGLVSAVEGEIDLLQDEIDQYNHNTYVELP